MDVEYLLGSLLRGVLTSRGKRKKMSGAMRYVLGNRRAVGGGAMLLGGLALALYESLTKGSGIGTAPGPVAGAPRPAVPGTARQVAGTVLPPLPTGARVVPPPLPAAALGGAAASSAPAAPATAEPQAPVADAPGTSVPPEVLRVIRLSISAARADGQLTEGEQDAIRSQARMVGAEALIADDLRASPPVADILAGVTGDQQREQLYSIAFAIVRADEQVSDGERMYLKQVGAALRLDDQSIARLEAEAVKRISDN